MKAVIFARVSSKDQEEGHSIDAQTAKMQNYCTQKGFNVAKAYQEQKAQQLASASSLR